MSGFIGFDHVDGRGLRSAPITSETTDTRHLSRRDTPGEATLPSGLVRIASLPWYDLSEVQPVHDRLWMRVAAFLHDAGVAELPGQLQRRTPYAAQWHNPGLLLGQACGYDTVLESSPPVQVVATPRFDWPGCQDTNYRSFVVVREDSPVQSVGDLRGLRCAINNRTSHSGMNCLRPLVAPLVRQGRFFASVTVSGSHEASLGLLRRQAADVAAIDCVTHGLLMRHRPSALAGTRIIAHTAAAPAPPFVTSRATPADTVAKLRRALATGIDALSVQDRDALGLRGIGVLPSNAYTPMIALADAAVEAGYRELPHPAGPRTPTAAIRPSVGPPTM